MIDILLPLLMLLIILIQIFLFYRSRKLSSPSYRIAVIGFPQTGKTTLLTTWVYHLLHYRNRDNELINPRGKSTIERTTDDYEKLELGEKLHSTTDQDVFAYRLDVEIGKWPKQLYKMEIGDYPGQDSEKFANHFNNKFHHTPYFKWIIEADAFIITFDVANLLQDEETMKKNIVKFTTSVESAWQHLIDVHLEGRRSLENKPIVLVFTKCDLFLHLEKEMTFGEHVSKKVQKHGFDKIPDIEKIDEEKLKHGVRHVFLKTCYKTSQ